jgi:molybdate transport system substrate-binding protein
VVKPRASVHRRRLGLLAIFGCLSILRGVHAASESEVLVAAASDLVFVFPELKESFESGNPGIKVRGTFGASGTLANQIRSGAPFDVFLSADMDLPRKVAESGHADAATLRPYAQGRLALWTASTNQPAPTSLADLLRPGIAHVAIAQPATAPYGRAAKEALRQAGLLDSLTPRLVYGENIAQAAQFVESGAAEFGIVSASALRHPDRLRRGHQLVLPLDSHPPIIQGAVLTRRAEGRSEPRRFLEFLGSETARGILGRGGLEPAPVDAAPTNRTGSPPVPEPR